MRQIYLIVIVCLAGCEKPVSSTINDQCLNAALFQTCLLSLPSGPLATKYNDWDEVVSECRKTAYYQSLRRRDVVEPRCAAE